MRAARYGEIVQAVIGKIDVKDIQPRLNAEEMDEYNHMKSLDADYFKKNGRHMVFEMPYQCFDDDFTDNEMNDQMYNSTDAEMAKELGIGKEE